MFKMPVENFYSLDNFFKKMTDLDSPKKNNDCYFYYYSTCAKGDNCTFRHEPSALGCETMCSFWKEGKCVNVHCNFRHMELRKNRKAIPCYWESQPVGCLKTHCPFLHQNPRPTESVNRANISTDQSVGDSNERKVTAVDSLVVNFEEESDNESMPTFSPKKGVDRIVTVKSLEEIRLEKVQAESAAYYSFDSFPEYQESDQANELRQRIYCRMMNKEPERIVIGKRHHSDSEITPIAEKRRKVLFDLKERIRFNRNKSRKVKSNDQLTRAISASKINTTNVDSIKIKTLEEIRAERKIKEQQIGDEQEVSSTSTDEVCIEKPSALQNVQRKIILRRVVKENSDNENKMKTEEPEDVKLEPPSKFDEGLLLEDDDDEDTVMLKPEDELLNEIDNYLDE